MFFDNYCESRVLILLVINGTFIMAFSPIIPSIKVLFVSFALLVPLLWGGCLCVCVCLVLYCFLYYYFYSMPGQERTCLSMLSHHIDEDTSAQFPRADLFALLRRVKFKKIFILCGKYEIYFIFSLS